MTNSITKSIDIAAPVSRVWRALTDHQEFGVWFQARLSGPFLVGHTCRGQITTPGYEHLQFTMQVREITPMARFVYAWHPYPADPTRDYEDEEPTVVTITLAPFEGGTRLTVVEAGFDAIPASRREEAFRANSGGWEYQMKNIADHVHTNP